MENAAHFADDHEPEGARQPVEWRSRYDGLVAIAYMGDKAIAGISGPWSDQFALTWWERPLPARQLELFDTLDDAKRVVEGWALRMRAGYPSHLPGVAANTSAPTTKNGLLDQVRALLPEFGLKRTRPSARENVERLRQLHDARDPDVSDLHFAAYE